MDLVSSEDDVSLRQVVADVGKKFDHEYFMARTKAGEPVTELWQALAELGFLGISLPEEYGGGGGTLWQLAIVAEELAAVGCPLQPLVYSQSIAGSILARYGTDEQKERWLRGLAAGTLKFSFALTESNSGSNSQGIATSARVEGGNYVLSGVKTFISGVDDADAILVVARTGTDERTNKGQLSLFIVDAHAPGLTRQPIPTALQAPDRQWTLFLEDVELGPDRLVGELHRGFRAVFDGLNPERVLGAAFSVGIGRYALDKASRYVKERAVWGVPIGTHQAVAHPMAQAKVELEAARLMLEKAARLYDAGLQAGESANMAKFLAAEASVHCLDSAIQVHGGNGFALEYGLTDMWWLARLLQVAPVSREMVLNFVAEHSLGLPKSY
ncbi:acyl-CoA dehydrogenase family protein [Rhodococcus sp. T7]|uniref:acyl-CoA dehydrogenase family protein n=1 Tax=Rhodococcus sp. T7 TaxID=627444 RepID=UPI00191733AC|nr:acyl-CoA dehydrogenase family protein [Rhodococcus sp. T7]